MHIDLTFILPLENSYLPFQTKLKYHLFQNAPLNSHARCPQGSSSMLPSVQPYQTADSLSGYLEVSPETLRALLLWSQLLLCRARNYVLTV